MDPLRRNRPSQSVSPNKPRLGNPPAYQGSLNLVQSNPGVY